MKGEGKEPGAGVVSWRTSPWTGSRAGRGQEGQSHGNGKLIRATETPHVVWRAGAGRNRLRERPGLSCGKWEVVEHLSATMSCSDHQTRSDIRIILKVS